MATRGLRIGLAGATGAVGTEVLALLDASKLPISQLVAVAGEDSLGSDIEFQGEVVSVTAELPALHGLDLFLNCAPVESTPDVVRAALRAEVPCIDMSGSFVVREEVPAAWIGGPPLAGSEPLLACPADASLAWLPVLRALGDVAPLVRVSGTILEAAAASGRGGLEALSRESLALFNQQDPEEESPLGRPVAFDCHPTSGPLDGGRRGREVTLAATLARWLDPMPAISARWVHVPAFIGQASSIRVVWERPVAVAEASDRLAKADGVELWSEGGEGPNLRAVSGRDVVLVSRPEVDAAEEGALRLWLVADPLRLAAANAVALAVARMGHGDAPKER